jgi:hypothetical protein
MSKAEWEAIYREAWSLYYTPHHMETLLRRAAATGASMTSLLKVLVTFATAVRLENVHPLQGGLFRLKHPSDRRPGMPKDNPLVFWPRFILEVLVKHIRLAGLILRLIMVQARIARSSDARTYTDQALTPVGDDEEEEKLDLLTQTTGAHEAIAHVKKIAQLTHSH